MARGQALRDSDDGRDVQDDAHTLRQDAQRRLCGLPVRGVVHEVSVNVEHVARVHRAHEVCPCALGCHRLGSLGGDKGALGVATNHGDAESVVHTLHAWSGIDDALASEGGLDHRRVGSGANRAEGDGLGSHPARRHERVEATAHVRAPVTGPFGAAAVNRTRPLKDTVHEDLPHEDHPAS